MRAVIVLAAIAAAAPAAAQGPYLPPLRANDLAANERYYAPDHADVNNQDEGKDIIARRFVSKGSWSSYKNDDIGSKTNENYVGYGKPFYAIASGEIIGCWRNAPENVPKQAHPAIAQGTLPRGGNSLWVRQDDGTFALYAHAIPGSIPSRLCPHDDPLLPEGTVATGYPPIRAETRVDPPIRIAAGERLGRIGNSGASSGPHLHVHVEKDGDPVAMRFARGMTALESQADLNGPWKPLNGSAMADAQVLLWPPRPVGAYTYKGTPTADYQRLFDHMVDSGMMPDKITCANGGASYDSWWVPNKGDWRSHHAMTAADATLKHAIYVATGYTRTSSFTCGPISVAVWRK